MNIILTFDYELYGDGSGDIFTNMVEPTNKILGTLNENNIKSTIFFEVIEYWKIKEQWDKGNKMGYIKNPVIAIENQLKQACRDGHDIQLHLHPQWLNSTWGNDGWKVDNSLWRLGEFERIQNYTLFDLISDGKTTLENMFTGINPSYKCHALRAGGYNILPSQNILSVMSRLGFVCESSVYPGGFEEGTLSRYDYRSIDIKKDFWYIDDDVLLDRKYKTSMIELPIFALPSIRIRKLFSKNRLISLLLNRKSAISSFTAKAKTKKTLRSKILFLFRKEYLTWDFCLFSNSMHNKYLNECLRLKNQYNRSTFTIIGHPKNFIDPKSLLNIISSARRLNISFTTISEFCNQKKELCVFSN
jgi:hypothetical protein